MTPQVFYLRHHFKCFLCRGAGATSRLLGWHTKLEYFSAIPLNVRNFCYLWPLAFIARDHVFLSCFISNSPLFLSSSLWRHCVQRVTHCLFLQNTSGKRAKDISVFTYQDVMASCCLQICSYRCKSKVRSCWWMVFLSSCYTHIRFQTVLDLPQAVIKRWRGWWISPGMQVLLCSPCSGWCFLAV